MESQQHNRQLAQTFVRDGVVRLERRAAAPARGRDFLASLRWMLEVFLMPTILAIGGWYVSQQLQEAQKQHSEQMSAAQLEATTLIEKQKIQLERTKHLAQLHAEVLSLLAQQDSGSDVHAMIRSMSTYGEAALPFLINLRAYIHSSGQCALDCSSHPTHKIIEEAMVKSFDSQLRISPINGFAGRNLRYAPLARADLRDVVFDGATLYKADFTDSDLRGASFSGRGTDLHGAVFERANLSGAKFADANVRKADFSYARLQDVDFSATRNVADAVFSIGGLGLAKFSLDDLARILESRHREIAALPEGFRNSTICKLQKNHAESPPASDGGDIRSLLQRHLTIPTDDVCGRK